MTINYKLLSSFKTAKRFKPFCNEGFFDNGVQSRQHAYMLGIAYGDGCVSFKDHVNKERGSFYVKLQLADINVLNNMRNMLESSHFISVTWDKRSKTSIRRPLAKLFVSSQRLSSTLCNLGCTPNKCDRILFPHEFVPEQYMWDFIRGYYEADGTQSFYKNGRCVLGFSCNSEPFLVGLKEFICSSLDVNSPAICGRLDKGTQLQWTKANDVAMITDMIYKTVIVQWL